MTYQALYHPSVPSDLERIGGSAIYAIQLIRTELLADDGNSALKAAPIEFLADTYALFKKGIYILYCLDEVLKTVYVLAVRKEGQDLKKQNPPEAGFQVSQTTNKERL